MCGILGQSTNNPKKISQGNIRILGVHNESRGKNSCGITIDGEIFYGIEKEKLFSDFMKGRKFDAKVFPIVFGHTRQSSVGIINEHNAHPFGFGENQRGDGYKFIGVHNGTLHNYKELADKYEISQTAPYVNTAGVTVERIKIDSEILLEILSKADKDDYSVLSEYEGRAALVWTDTDNPNTIYLWSGKSRPSSYSTDATACEERPLNVYIESKNNFYFSSTPEGLELIGGEKEEIFQIEYNTVYVVRNGDFAHARKIKVSRDDAWHESWGGNYRTGGFRNNSGTNTNMASTGTNSRVSKEYNFPANLDNTPSSHVKDYMERRNSLIKGATPNEAFGSSSSLLNIYDDKTLKPKIDYKNAYRVYHEKFRYWKDGNLINGVWIYDPTFGFIYIAESKIHALRLLTEYRNVKYVDGSFDVKDNNTNLGRIILSTEDKNPILYYFINGMLLKDEIDYNVLRDRKVRHGDKFIEDYILISHTVAHPIIDISVDRKPDDSQLIYKDGVLFTGLAYSIGWEKRYNVRDGNVINAQAISSALTIVPNTSDKKYLPEVYNVEIYNRTRNFIENFERSYEWAENNKKIHEKSRKDLEFDEEFNQQLAEEEVQMKEQSDEEFYAGEFSNIIKSTDEVNDIIQDIANKHLTNCLIAFHECEIAAKDWKEHPSAKELIRCCNSMESILNEYITAK